MEGHRWTEEGEYVGFYQQFIDQIAANAVKMLTPDMSAVQTKTRSKPEGVKPDSVLTKYSLIYS